ncbi:MAG: hypothetical protein FJ308_08095 [Planctomycetes bacterium]|nr:hypothetical protein [Planctomycetota bacterium]
MRQTNSVTGCDESLKIRFSTHCVVQEQDLATAGSEMLMPVAGQAKKEECVEQELATEKRRVRRLANWFPSGRLSLRYSAG